MKTLRLDLNSLEVESFTITRTSESEGWAKDAAAPTVLGTCTRNISCKNTHCC